MGKSTDWATFHGDSNRTGNVAGLSITAANVGNLKTLHTLEIGGAILSVPAIAGGFVYVGTANGTTHANGEIDPNGGSFHKIALDTGEIAKSYYWASARRDGDTHGFTGMGCTPAIVEGRVYFSAFDGRLYCLDAETLEEIWIVNLRVADPAHKQPVTNVFGVDEGNPQPEGWCSPLVVNGKVYVGIGEGENPDLYAFVFCLDAETGDVIWIFCTCQFVEGEDNKPNVLPGAVVAGALPAGYTSYYGDVVTKACVVWSALSYDATLNRVYCNTGNPQPDSTLPSRGYSISMMSLDADTGELKGRFQPPPQSSYRPSDLDVDFGASPMLFTRVNADGTSQRLVCAGCKNGGFFMLDAGTMKLVKWRQILPYHNDGSQIATVDPHGPDDPDNPNPRVSNEESNGKLAENFHGTYSTPALDPEHQRIFIGSGGNNYHFVAAGIDHETTPFMRAFDWTTLEDAWEMDDGDPKRYVKPAPPMYETAGEAALSSPAVVNDVVFCSTSRIALYAFDVRHGAVLWSDHFGEQTGGFNGGYGYCLGPAVAGDYVVAGGLVFGRDGGVLLIYRLDEGD